MRGSAALVLALLATSAHAGDAIPAPSAGAAAPAANEGGAAPAASAGAAAPAASSGATAPAPSVDATLPAASEDAALAAPSEDVTGSLEPGDEFGPVLLIERIDIVGNIATQDDVIRRALPIAPGDVLRASDKRLRAARFKVLALGFFRDVTFTMAKGSQRGNVVIRIEVFERGTFVLNRLWFGATAASSYWFGTDVGDRNLFGLGIAAGAGLIYAAHGDIAGTRDQWAGELRLADGSLRGSRWGASGALTFARGSDFYRAAGSDADDDPADFLGFPYRRLGARLAATYDVTALTRLSIAGRIESITADLPTAPTRTLPDGRVVGVDLHLEPGTSRIVTAGFALDRDTRSDSILPHAGSRITAAAEVGTSALASDYDFATLFARYEHWWPLREERHAIGVRLVGGVVIGNAPRFDRIHISDVNRMVTPRALGLVLSSAAPLDILTTRGDKPTWGELGGAATVEYAARLFRGSGKRRVYGGDMFFGLGLWGLAEAEAVQLRDSTVWSSLPLDVYVDAGLRIDTDLGIFELTVANALGRVR